MPRWLWRNTVLCSSRGSIRSTRLQSDRRERAQMLRPSLRGMREYERGAFNLHKVESWLGEVNGERSLRIIASTVCSSCTEKAGFVRSFVCKKKRAGCCDACGSSARYIAIAIYTHDPLGLRTRNSAESLIILFIKRSRIDTARMLKNA